MGNLQVMDSDHNKDLYSILLIKVSLTVYLVFVISIETFITKFVTSFFLNTMHCLWDVLCVKLCAVILK